MTLLTTLDSTAERHARVALTYLVSDRGARIAPGDAPRVLETIAAVDEEAHRRVEALRPATLLERAAESGIRFVTPDDDEWPTVLDDLTHPPVGLWVRGPVRLDSAVRSSVAVVGSRSATTYGTHIAADMSCALAEKGKTIISGAAFGIDNAAHRGALAAKAATVAVLACGVDRAYPAAHRSLLDYIADTGVVVSEQPPGAAPTRPRFLARNRIIAALAQGTLVVEAAVRSGALNTARHARELGRPLGAVPGPITSAPSDGCHQLIRLGHARLVTESAHMVELIAEHA